MSAEVAQAILDDVLIAYAADALGAAQAVLTLAVDYAKVRRQFDQPIGSFQAVQHLCVDMYETVELARGGVIHALWAADAADPTEHHLAALRAKAFAGRLATVGDTAIQVFGGIGFTWEHDAHLYLRRLLSFSAMAGGSDRYLEAIGKHLALSVNGPDRNSERFPMSEVLRGVRVVELASWTYVPAAGAALADWGADVIKVEDVRGGDPGAHSSSVASPRRQPARTSTSSWSWETAASAASRSTSSPTPAASTSAASWPPPTCS